MADVKLNYINDTYMWIDCENHIAYDLDDYFTFYVPGYKFMPAYKNKQWDGTIHLFRLRNREIYCGLVKYVEEFCRNHDLSIEIDPNLKKHTSIEPAEVDQFVESLNLHSRGEPIEARHYQLFAIWSALRNKRALLLSPTSSGKSLMIYCICRALESVVKGKILILVPTTSLVTQMYGDFADYSSEDEWDVDEHVHKIFGGKDKFAEQKIFVSTWQSIYKMKPEYFEQFNALIVDEAHLATSNSIRNVAENMNDCPYKFGFTGTLSGMKTSQLVLEGLLGEVVNVTTTKKLMDEKSVAELLINQLILKYTDEERCLLKKAKYKDEVDWLYSHPRRTAFIAKLASIQTKNSLLLFNHKKQGKEIFDRIVEMVDDDRQVYYITGDMDGEEREAIRHKIEQEKDSIIVASYGVFSTGVSIKNIHSVVFCSPTKSKIRTLQSIGRGLRMNASKSSVVLYDIVDDLSYKSHVNYGIKHYIERSNYYAHEKFETSTHKIAI